VLQRLSLYNQGKNIIKLCVPGIQWLTLQRLSLYNQGKRIPGTQSLIIFLP
jgi:hypothetical protein